jgi:hypothetical protein
MERESNLILQISISVSAWGRANHMQVEIGHAARHAEDADPVPWEYRHDHADEPQPPLRAGQPDVGQRPPGEMAKIFLRKLPRTHHLRIWR